MNFCRLYFSAVHCASQISHSKKLASQRPQGFLDRRQPVRPVHLIEVDVVGLEPPQARFTGPHYVQARGSDIVRAVIHPVREFGGDDRLVAAADQRGTQLFLGHADAVTVGSVEVIDALT
jgi:hypothetical protein